MQLQKPLRNFYFYCCFFSCTRKYLFFSKSAQTRANLPLSYCNEVSQIYYVFATKLSGKSKEGILCINSPIIAWTCWHWLCYFKPGFSGNTSLGFHLWRMGNKKKRSKGTWILTDLFHESLHRRVHNLLTRWWRRRFSGTRNDVTQTGWRVSSWFTGVK